MSSPFDWNNLCIYIPTVAKLFHFQPFQFFSDLWLLASINNVGFQLAFSLQSQSSSIDNLHNSVLSKAHLGGTPVVFRIKKIAERSLLDSNYLADNSLYDSVFGATGAEREICLVCCDKCNSTENSRQLFRRRLSCPVLMVSLVF